MRALPWGELDADPPKAYIDFVAQHLAGLRRAVLSAIDDRERAEQLYPEVLTDVALAWRRLESAHHRGRTDAAGDYLDRCLHRRLYGPGDNGSDAEADERAFEVSFVVWDADSSALPHLPPQRRVNAAARLAGQILPHVDPEPAPLAEAAIAWWHAYEHRRRWRYVAWLVLAVVLVLLPVATTSTTSANF